MPDVLVSVAKARSIMALEASTVNQKVFLQKAIAEIYVTYNTYEYRVL
ncbi:hypothetical protein H6G35_32635 [Aulosira sp. FACHB-113]|nr:hypothetical protein [Aulosira sp. FACHB-113]